MPTPSPRPIRQPKSRVTNRLSKAPPPHVPRVQAPPLHQLSNEDQQRIQAAAISVEENELLVWTSLERNESIPQTKLHFERAMLFINSDEEGGNKTDDDMSGESGSIEWEETVERTEEDDERLQAGVSFGPQGWWDPRKDASVEERLSRKYAKELAERRVEEEVVEEARVSEQVGIEAERVRKRKSIGGTARGGESASGTPERRMNSGKSSGKGKRPHAGGSSLG